MNKVNNSVSQDGELLKEDHRVKNSWNQSFQPFSGGMVLVVGRNSEKYFIPVNMHLKIKQTIIYQIVGIIWHFFWQPMDLPRGQNFKNRNFMKHLTTRPLIKTRIQNADPIKLNSDWKELEPKKNMCRTIVEFLTPGADNSLTISHLYQSKKLLKYGLNFGKLVTPLLQNQKTIPLNLISCLGGKTKIKCSQIIYARF